MIPATISCAVSLATVSPAPSQMIDQGAACVAIPVELPRASGGVAGPGVDLCLGGVCVAPVSPVPCSS